MKKNLPKDAARDLPLSLRPLMLAIYATEDGIPRQPWALVSLAEEILASSRPSGRLHQHLAAARRPKRGFSAEALFSSVLSIIEVGMLDAVGVGSEARLKVSDRYRPTLDACWKKTPLSDKKAINFALHRLEASSVALSKMRRTSGDFSEGTVSDCPLLRQVS